MPLSIVHVLYEGNALCGRMSRPPSSWPAGHGWVHAHSRNEHPKEATRCELCFEIAALPYKERPAAIARARANTTQKTFESTPPVVSLNMDKRTAELVQTCIEAHLAKATRIEGEDRDRVNAVIVDLEKQTERAERRALALIALNLAQGTLDYVCPCCGSKLEDVVASAEDSHPGNIDRRMCTSTTCDFWVSLEEIERLKGLREMTVPVRIPAESVKGIKKRHQERMSPNDPRYDVQVAVSPEAINEALENDPLPIQIGQIKRALDGEVLPIFLHDEIELNMQTEAIAETLEKIKADNDKFGRELREWMDTPPPPPPFITPIITTPSPPKCSHCDAPAKMKAYSQSLPAELALIDTCEDHTYKCDTCNVFTDTEGTCIYCNQGTMRAWRLVYGDQR